MIVDFHRTGKACPPTGRRYPAPVTTAHGRVVAEVTASGILDRRTFVVLRKPEPCLGYDLATLAQAIELGATLAVNRDQSRGISYSAPIERIFGEGFEIDLGWGKQIMLPIRRWDKLNADGSVVRAAADATPPKPQQAQLGFFDEEVAK